MIKNLKDEVWKLLHFAGHKSADRRYALSNKGRIVSFKNDLMVDGKILSGSYSIGYHTLNIHSNTGPALYIHREIAKLFLPRKSKSYNYVIHLNHNKMDNRAENLQWVNFKTMMAHQQHSPAVKAFRIKQANKTMGQKLTATQVRTIKQLFNRKNPSFTKTAIASKYGVSENTIYRILRGENWGHIKI